MAIRVRPTDDREEVSAGDPGRHGVQCRTARCHSEYRSMTSARVRPQPKWMMTKTRAALSLSRGGLPQRRRSSPPQPSSLRRGNSETTDRDHHPGDHLSGRGLELHDARLPDDHGRHVRTGSHRQRNVDLGLARGLDGPGLLGRVASRAGASSRGVGRWATSWRSSASSRRSSPFWARVASNYALAVTAFPFLALWYLHTGAGQGGVRYDRSLAST